MSLDARIFALLSLCWACNRTEAAPGPGSEQPAPLQVPASTPALKPSAAAEATSAAAPSALASGLPLAEPARPPCVEPLLEPAPPRATPARTCPKEPGKAPQFEQGALTFKEAKGSPRLTLEVARTPDAHAHGLMFRTQMPENHGMLFEWGAESRRVFWMHNTCLPLDMLFIARDGTVAGILEQVPVLNDEPRTIPCPASYVLEVNAGWCRRHGVKPGMRMSLE